MARSINGRRSTAFAIATLFLFAPLRAAASAVAPPLAAVRMGTRSGATAAAATEAAEVVAAEAPADEAPAPGIAAVADGGEAPSQSSNPLVQLANYVKKTCVDFKDGLFQMKADHRRCDGIRAKQRAFAKARGAKRPRGIRGIQTGGISYEEYDFLRKGLVDRNKLFAVVMVSICLPNYFVYYLWSFPDMMPTPFLKGREAREISRERCHAVVSTLLEMEKGARVAPWTSKLNPFGRGATERAMGRMGSLVATGCSALEEPGATGPDGGRWVLERLRPRLYTSEPPTKQQRLLAGNVVPKQVMKGLTRAIGADPLNKGSSPFGVSAIKHIESVALADEFLVDQGVDLGSLGPTLLTEACSARLIGNPGWTDERRREALASWLAEAEVAPREAVAGGGGALHHNGNLARAALMCYNAVDGTRDAGSDSGLARAMYRGPQAEAIAVN